MIDLLMLSLPLIAQGQTLESIAHAVTMCPKSGTWHTAWSFLAEPLSFGRVLSSGLFSGAGGMWSGVELPAGMQCPAAGAPSGVLQTFTVAKSTVQQFGVHAHKSKSGFSKELCICR